MRSKRSSRPSWTDRRRGVGLIEVLVALGVVGITLGAAGSFLRKQAGDMRRTTLRVESQQALRGSLDAITRDLRLAGACLPSDGRFVAVAGADQVGGDQITIRMGIVDADMSCVDTTVDNGDDDLSDPEGAGSTTIDVNSSEGFIVGQRVFVRHPNGSGDLSSIVGVGGTSVTILNGLSQVFPEGSGVYPLEERAYAIDASDPDLPVLTIQVNGGPVLRFAAGVEDIQVQYVLNDNCPTCTVVNLPADTATWWTVNEVVVTARARTIGPVLPEDQVQLTMLARAKPRNLLP